MGADADTSTRILEAARRAPVQHGYDGLSMAKVADEIPLVADALEAYVLAEVRR